MGGELQPPHSPRLSHSRRLTTFTGSRALLILFCLPFQGIRDRLYQDPMEVQTPGQAFTAFLGAMGFTRPVEQLGLRSVPLPSLLFWLRRPKGINLVEATMPAGEAGSTSACRSMAIAVSEEMLYKGQMPSCGGWPGVHAALCATGTVQRSLHESGCVA